MVDAGESLSVSHEHVLSMLVKPVASARFQVAQEKRNRLTQP